MNGTQLSRKDFDAKLEAGEFADKPLVRQRDWSEPYYGWSEVSGRLTNGESVWCKAYPAGDRRNSIVD